MAGTSYIPTGKSGIETHIEKLSSTPRSVGLEFLKQYGVKTIIVVTKSNEFHFSMDKIKNMRAISENLCFVMKDEFSENGKIFEFFNENIEVLEYIT